MSDSRFDLVVIGSGPGGYVAAIRASQLGLKTCIVEERELGGVCLNWGCIPTKALLNVSELLGQIRTAHRLGIRVPDGTSVDLEKVIEHSRAVAGTLSQGVTSLLSKNKVVVKPGRARFLDSQRIQVQAKDGTAEQLQAKNIIVATGARPRTLNDFVVDNRQIWDYKGALRPDDLPKSLLILGAGAIGVEFACFYSALGTDVTVVEMQERVLPSEDADISAALLKSFTERGIKVVTGTSAKLLKQTKKHVEVEMTSQDKQRAAKFEKVLVCAGVVGNIDDIGLEYTQVKTANGFVIVDENGQSSQAGVFAIGDVAGAPMLAHKASHEAIRCVEHLAGHPSEEIRNHDIPSCVYSEPQVARIGLTEEQARKARTEVVVGRFPFQANGKAVATVATEGFVKTIFDKQSGQLLGAHLIGPNVTELLHGLTMAQQLEATEETLMTHMFAHPTLSEALGESAMAAYKRALHI